MTKYDYYVYLTISEMMLKISRRKSTFFSYRGYCGLMRSQIKSNSLSDGYSLDIIAISEQLDLIYSMNDATTGKYIADFFDLEIYIKFEKLVKVKSNLYPNKY